MKKWIIRFIALSLVSLTSFAETPTNPNYATAQSVIENWFSAMKAQQFVKAATYLAPQFTSLHTDGITRNKQQEMQLIRSLHMQDYHLTNFHFSQSGDAIVVSYQDQSVEKIDKQTIAPCMAGRLAVLQKQGDSWLILGYANLDQIK